MAGGLHEPEVADRLPGLLLHDIVIAKRVPWPDSTG